MSRYFCEDGEERYNDYLADFIINKDYAMNDDSSFPFKISINLQSNKNVYDGQMSFFDRIGCYDPTGGQDFKKFLSFKSFPLFLLFISRFSSEGNLKDFLKSKFLITSDIFIDYGVSGYYINDGKVEKKNFSFSDLKRKDFIYVYDSITKKYLTDKVIGVDKDKCCDFFSQCIGSDNLINNRNKIVDSYLLKLGLKQEKKVEEGKMRVRYFVLSPLILVKCGDLQFIEFDSCYGLRYGNYFGDGDIQKNDIMAFYGSVPSSFNSNKGYNLLCWKFDCSSGFEIFDASGILKYSEPKSKIRSNQSLNKDYIN